MPSGAGPGGGVSATRASGAGAGGFASVADWRAQPALVQKETAAATARVDLDEGEGHSMSPHSRGLDLPRGRRPRGLRGSLPPRYPLRGMLAGGYGEAASRIQMRPTRPSAIAPAVFRIRRFLFLAAVVSLLPLLPLRAAPPDAIVAADGSAQFRSIQEAISVAPHRTNHEARWTIFVKAGTYRERVYVQRERGYITLIGEDAARTILVYGQHANMTGPDGKPLGTFRTPTLQVDGDGFEVHDLTIANDAGPVGQALALRADGDRLVFRRCRFLGWQDTLLVNRGRHYFEDCYVEGHVDFIFGGATVFFSRCEIHSLQDGYITAASTPEGAAHGFVFADGRITGAPGVKTFLGRPWRPFARTIWLRTEMSANVRPEGWDNWNKPDAGRTTFYAEFGSLGPGASPDTRVRWAKPLTAADVAALTPGAVLGGSDNWNPVREPGPKRVQSPTSDVARILPATAERYRGSSVLKLQQRSLRFPGEIRGPQRAGSPFSHWPSQPSTVSCHWMEFCGLRIQWFSSGK